MFTAIGTKFNEFQDLISEEELLGGATDEEYNRIQRYYMESSQNSAIEQALKLADLPYEMTYKGVYVMGIDPNSSFAGKISVGEPSPLSMAKSLKVAKTLSTMYKVKPLVMRSP